MGRKQNFNAFTYGVGIEVDAQSFKQVKDDLKLNLKSAKKLVKDFEKELKLNPDADLSDLFATVREIKSITDGIQNSDNSLGDFVDKTTLNGIAELERKLASVEGMSERVEGAFEDLKGTLLDALGGVKDAGAIAFPGTFDNLFKNIKV